MKNEWFDKWAESVRTAIWLLQSRNAVMRGASEIAVCTSLAAAKAAHRLLSGQCETELLLEQGRRLSDAMRDRVAAMHRLTAEDWSYRSK